MDGDKRHHSSWCVRGSFLDWHTRSARHVRRGRLLVVKRFIRILRSASLLPVILLSSCLDLDDSLFNPQKLSSYTLSTSVIPESQRVFVTLKSEGYHIYGYFVRSRNIDND